MPRIPPPEAYPAGSLERTVTQLTYRLGTEGRPGSISPFAFHGGACLGVGFHGGLGDLPCAPVGAF